MLEPISREQATDYNLKAMAIVGKLQKMAPHPLWDIDLVAPGDDEERTRHYTIHAGAHVNGKMFQSHLVLGTIVLDSTLFDYWEHLIETMGCAFGREVFNFKVVKD